MRITSPLTKTVGSDTYAYTYDPNHPHAVKAISYTGTSPVDMGPRTISYNAEQMPIRIEQIKAGNTIIVDYLYDGMSTRIKKSVQGGSTTYYIGEHCEVINGVLTNYIFAGNLRVAKVTGSTRYYFHKDHLGSSTAMTDATGAKVETTEYVPYGEMREHQGTEVTNYKFTDQELDPETGLYNYGARLYDPVIGRFITPDTIIPDIYDPQMLNRYSYCRNNPLIYVDPNGHGWGNDKGTGPGDSPGHGNDSEGGDPGPGDGDSDANGAGMSGGFGSISDPKATEPADNDSKAADTTDKKDKSTLGKFIDTIKGIQKAINQDIDKIKEDMEDETPETRLMAAWAMATAGIVATEAGAAIISGTAIATKSPAAVAAVAPIGISCMVVGFEGVKAGWELGVHAEKDSKSKQ